MNKMNEWEELYNLSLGMEKYYGMLKAIRVPGGIVYHYIEEKIQNKNIYSPNGSYSSEIEEEVSVSITFAPFPPGLYEKLFQL